MSCRVQMLLGLGQRPPWVGLDEDVLDSCFTHAAAVIVKVAVSGQRPEWRSAADLERAQVAAFRHQAYDQWKRVNAQSRQGERHALAFDPDLHGAGHAPMDRLFDQPDLHTIERDLLAELSERDLRRFWTLVLHERLSFKLAGDRLGLNKAEVMTCTRAGRSAFSSYLDARATGELCQQRGRDIYASRAGRADELTRERAAAHIEACYACALVHEPTTSAFERGILGLAPTGVVLRLLSRAGDVASTPAIRIADSGSGSRAIAAGVAALTIGAGAGAGLPHFDAPTSKPGKRSTSTAKQSAEPERPRPVKSAFLPRQLATTTAAGADSQSAGNARTDRKPKVKRKPMAGPSKTPRQPAAATSVAEQEFNPEIRDVPTVPSKRAASNPATGEFTSP